MPTEIYEFTLQPGSYELGELKTIRDLVQRVRESKGNIYVRITDTDENTRVETHSGELKIKANGWGDDIIPIYIHMRSDKHLRDRPRDTNRAGGWYRFPLSEPDICKLVEYDFDIDAIENGGEIDSRYNYVVIEDYL